MFLHALFADAELLGDVGDTGYVKWIFAGTDPVDSETGSLFDFLNVNVYNYV